MLRVAVRVNDAGDQRRVRGARPRRPQHQLHLQGGCLHVTRCMWFAAACAVVLMPPCCCIGCACLQGFQPGLYTLYACAIDTSGARTCATVSVRVAEPVAVSASAAIALVEDSVAKIDVSQLASTGGRQRRPAGSCVCVRACMQLQCKLAC